VRARSRSGSERLERSVSRELYTEEKPKLSEIKQLVESSQDFMYTLLKEHKEEIEDKLTTKNRRFASKQLEKQFQVNFKFKELVQKIQQALKDKSVKKAKKIAEELEEALDEHEQDLIIADISPHGWLAVSKLRNSSDLPKSVRKRLATVEKDLDAQRAKNGGNKKKFLNVSTAGQESAGKKPERKYSPEEALSYAARQVRTGTCSHCQKAYHFYRECPVFWTKVNESREAKAKGADSAN
jgi:YesN/AraC family two-component response regulator